MSGLSRRSSYVYAGLEGTIRGRNIVCPRIDVKCIFRVPLLSYASSGGRSRDSKDDQSVDRLSLSLSPSHSVSSVRNHNVSKFPSLKSNCAPFNAKNSATRVLFLSFYKRKEIHRYRSVITRTRDPLILLNRHREETFSPHIFYRCICLRYTINESNILNIITTRFDSRLLHRMFFFLFFFSFINSIIGSVR